MADKRAPQVEPAINSQARVRFDLLGQQLGENDLFSKILRASNYGVLARTAAARKSSSGATKQPQGTPSREARGHFSNEMGSRPRA